MGYTLPDPEAKPPKLDPSMVPEQFKHLIPIAEKYGITDDCYRDELIESLNLNELKECASFLESYDDVLDQWLAVSADPPFTKEYITFSALSMTAELAEMKLNK
ncbi:hypothetical protein P4E94_19295 [Pontiellaceae bacterium B12219]|nr:hypothetical protein [Pontiellaceae bacterium B12219]